METDNFSHQFITGFEKSDIAFASTNPESYFQLLNQRKTRAENAFNSLTNNEYHAIPLPTLEALRIQAAITVKEYYRKGNLLNYNKLVDDIVAEANRKIDNKEYCVDGTVEWQYRLNYFAAWENFNTNWPDATEIAIREQEKHLYQHLLDNDDLSD